MYINCVSLKNDEANIRFVTPLDNLTASLDESLSLFCHNFAQHEQCTVQLGGEVDISYFIESFDTQPRHRNRL